MKLFLLIVFFSFSLFANELDDIDSIIKESRVEFSDAKKAKDIKKLTDIVKKLYDNHQNIKKLKIKKDLISFKCNNTPCKEPKLKLKDKLTIIFNLSFDEKKEYKTSTLLWQLQKDKKIVRNESKKILKEDIDKPIEYDITIDESFKKGKYRIAMHHKSSTGTQKSKKYIEIIQPLLVKPLVVSINKEAKSSDEKFYSSNDLYILSGFELENNKEKINIDVNLEDLTKGETLLKGSFKRPKDGNTDTKQPLRFKIPASKLYDNQKLKFNIKLYKDGITPISKEIIVNIEKKTVKKEPVKYIEKKKPIVATKKSSVDGTPDSCLYTLRINPSDKYEFIKSTSKGFSMVCNFNGTVGGEGKKIIPWDMCGKRYYVDVSYINFKVELDIYNWKDKPVKGYSRSDVKRDTIIKSYPMTKQGYFDYINAKEYSKVNQLKNYDSSLNPPKFKVLYNKVALGKCEEKNHNPEQLQHFLASKRVDPKSNEKEKEEEKKKKDTKKVSQKEKTTKNSNSLNKSDKQKDINSKNSMVKQTQDFKYQRELNECRKLKKQLDTTEKNFIFSKNVYIDMLKGFDQKGIQYLDNMPESKRMRTLRSLSETAKTKEEFNGYKMEYNNLRAKVAMEASRGQALIDALRTGRIRDCKTSLSNASSYKRLFDKILWIGAWNKLSGACNDMGKRRLEVNNIIKQSKVYNCDRFGAKVLSK